MIIDQLILIYCMKNKFGLLERNIIKMVNVEKNDEMI